MRPNGSLWQQPGSSGWCQVLQGDGVLTPARDSIHASPGAVDSALLFSKRHLQRPGGRQEADMADSLGAARRGLGLSKPAWAVGRSHPEEENTPAEQRMRQSHQQRFRERAMCRLQWQSSSVLRPGWAQTGHVGGWVAVGRPNRMLTWMVNGRWW